MSLSDLKDSCIGRIQSSSTLKELEDSRVHIFGKTGTLTQALKELSKTIKTLDNEAKKAQGQMVNEIKKSLKEAFDNRRKILSKKAMEEKLQSEKVDVTLPCSTVSKGGIHPITKTIFDIKNYFSKLGFDLREAG